MHPAEAYDSMIAAANQVYPLHRRLQVCSLLAIAESERKGWRAHRLDVYSESVGVALDCPQVCSPEHKAHLCKPRVGAIGEEVHPDPLSRLNC